MTSYCELETVGHHIVPQPPPLQLELPSGLKAGVEGPADSGSHFPHLNLAQLNGFFQEFRYFNAPKAENF